MWLLNQLTAKNAIDQVGWRPFGMRVTLFAVLNLVMIALILHPVPAGASLAGYLSSLYVYFIPLLALSAAVGSFEVDLFAGTGEWLLLAPSAWWRARLLAIALELIVPILVYVALFIFTARPWADWVLALALLLVFTWLGLGIGFVFGFKNEKSINNFTNAIIWILGFGPGPFMGLQVKPYQFAFPGAQSLVGDYASEGLKLGAYVLIAVSLTWWARRPRRYRFFAK